MQAAEGGSTHSSLVRAGVTEYHGLGGGMETEVIAYTSGGWTSKIKAPAWSGSWFTAGTFSLCPHRMAGARELSGLEPMVRHSSHSWGAAFMA